MPKAPAALSLKFDLSGRLITLPFASQQKDCLFRTLRSLTGEQMGGIIISELALILRREIISFRGAAVIVPLLLLGLEKEKD